MRKSNSGKLFDTTYEYFETMAELENRKKELYQTGRYNKSAVVRIDNIRITVNNIGGLDYRLSITRVTR